MKEIQREYFFGTSKKITRKYQRERILEKRIYDIETVIVQIRELCGEPKADTPWEILMIMELCTDILRK